MHQMKGQEPHEDREYTEITKTEWKALAFVTLS